MRLDRQNPMTKVLVATLSFEAVVFALSIAGMIQVSSLPTGTSVAIGAAAAVLALVAAATLRRPLGYPLAWLTQVVGIGLGFATAWMFLVGGIFALLWLVTFVLGRRIDAARAG